MNNSLSNDIQHLHQLILNLAARLQATEAIANAAMAPAQAIKPELDQWLRQREQDVLNADLKKITTQIEQLRGRANIKQAVN